MDTNQGGIAGMPFDLVCNIMSSLEGKGEEYRNKKLSYPENMPFEPSEENIMNGHGKEGFIKAGVYFLFDRKNTEYSIIGNIQHELYLKLINYINNMEPSQIKYIIDNLTPPDEGNDKKQ
ncbi:MAG: hypothetical protein NC399_09815 [Muribaculum sp.]|nr:hypothetical protein [Muribaculum sp.]